MSGWGCLKNDCNLVFVVCRLTRGSFATNVVTSMSTRDSVLYELVAVESMQQQVVAGMNYKLVCEVRLKDSPNVTSRVMMIVFKPLPYTNEPMECKDAHKL